MSDNNDFYGDNRDSIALNNNNLHQNGDFLLKTMITPIEKIYFHFHKLFLQL
ncbi:MAG: hypothetical protein LBR28_07480 [Bacteroidales bacterium]|nr:hypothetical protein [Bacteroidales bacterium]